MVSIFSNLIYHELDLEDNKLAYAYFIHNFLSIELNKNNQSTINISDENRASYKPSLTQDLYNIKILDKIIPLKILSQDKKAINNIIFDSDEKSIVIILNPFSKKKSELMIEIPRFILDSQVSNKDKNFTVFINDKLAQVKELRNVNESNSLLDNITSTTMNEKNDVDINSSRKLIIEFGEDSKVIEIVGTETYNINTTANTNRVYQKIPIELENKTTYIDFSIQGGNLEKAYLNKTLENKSLDLFIVPYSTDGELMIEIPRFILDSQVSNKDKNFTVFINDKLAQVKELRNVNESNSLLDNITSTTMNEKNDVDINSSRKLIIEFGEDSKVIEIVGTETYNINTTLGENEIQKREQKQTDENLGILTLIFFSLIGLVIVIIIIIITYRKGKLKFRR